MGKHPDLAQPLVSFARRLGCHPLARGTLSLCQRPLGLGELFPEPLLALILGLESRECIGVLSSARLGQGLDRLSQELSCPGSPDVSGENKKELRVPIEGFGELYERLSNGPLDLARLDPADLRSREAAPPRQPPHRKTRAHARLFGHLGHSHLGQRLHQDPSLAALCTVGQTLTFASDANSYCYLKQRSPCGVSKLPQPSARASRSARGVGVGESSSLLIHR